MAYDGSISFDTKTNTDGFQEGVNRIAGIISGSSVFKLLEKGFQVVANSIDKAVERYDTLQKFPQVLQQMGFGAEEASAATSKLSEGIQGLPTTLDSVVSTAQRLTVLTKNLEKSTDLTLALNNAFLAGGASGEAAARGQEQYIQMLATGKVDMQSWKILMENMGYALDKVAASFGYAGESAVMELYAALQDGTITFNDFSNRLIKLNNEVGGFADMAKTSSGGIKTAWTNLSTGIVRATASIIEAIDEGLSQTRFKSIQNIIEQAAGGISKALSALTPVFELLAANLELIAPAVLLVCGALGAYKTATLVSTAATSACKAVAKAFVATISEAGTAMELWTMGQTSAGVASAGLTVAQTALAAVTGVLTGEIGLATAAQLVLNAAWKANPIGLVVAIAAGAIAAIGAITKACQKATAAFEAQSSAVTELADNQQSLVQSHEQSTKALNDNLKSIRANADAALTLVEANRALLGADARSADQKTELSRVVEQLNSAYDGLNLAYDESTDSLNMTTEQLTAYIEAQHSLQQTNAMQEQYNELLREESAIRQEQGELDNKEAELAAQLEDKILEQNEYNKLMEQLNQTRSGYIEQEALIAQSKAELDTQIQEIDTAAAQQIIDNTKAQQVAAQALAAAEEQAAKRREAAITSFTEAATGMFDTLKTQSDVSVAEMIANLQTNQEAMSNYEANMQALRDRFAALGLDDAVLTQLANMGTEGIPYVAELVNGSDEQLQQMSGLYTANIQAGTNAALVSVGEGTVQIAGEVQNQVSEVRSAADAAVAANSFEETGHQQVDDMAQGVADNPSLQEQTQQAVQQTKAAADDAVTRNTFADTGRQQVEDMAKGVREPPALSDASRESVNNARKSATDAVASAGFAGVGEQMIGGITEGVRQGTSGLVRAMQDAVAEAAAAAAAKAEIHSPSRLFRNLIGLNIMEGWADGIYAGIPLLQSSLDTAVDKLADTSLEPIQATDLVAAMQSGIAATQAHIAHAGTAAAASSSVTNNRSNVQNIYFEQPMQAPDEIARALRIQQTYGLAGER